MGGTSTDVATIIGGKEAFTTAFEIEWGVPIQIPMIDIRTIGAGGGSIAWMDKGGMLRVGPQSAGAVPGPACYGQGGTLATVTDANLVLGRLNPDYFLGGRMTLDADAAHRAVAAVAEQVGLSSRGHRTSHCPHRRQQHGGCIALGPDRARAGSTRFHALRLRRRWPAACTRP